jgi:hypothetical protein
MIAAATEHYEQWLAHTVWQQSIEASNYDVYHGSLYTILDVIDLSSLPAECTAAIMSVLAWPWSHADQRRRHRDAEA